MKVEQFINELASIWSTLNEDQKNVIATIIAK